MTTNETVSITLPVSLQTLRDLLCTASEGGSNYWADIIPIARTEDLDYLRIKVTEHTSHEVGGKRINRYVDAEDLARGLVKLAEAACRDSFPTAAKHFANALQDHDATTADVVLQMTVFGDVVYG